MKIIISAFVLTMSFAQARGSCADDFRTLVHIIPVIGDTHGNLEGVLATIQKLQHQLDRPIDFAVRVGDNGYWLDEAQVETSERRGMTFELASGFQRYLATDELHRRYRVDVDGLNRVNTTILDTWGNHDDGVRIKNLLRSFPGQPLPLDRYGKIFLLPEGAVTRIRGKEVPVDIRIAALGGIEEASRGKAGPEVSFHRDSVDDLLSLGSSSVDVFVTHQGTTEALKGSDTVDSLIDLMKPKIHLHGHSHQTTVFRRGKTLSHGLGRMPGERRPEPSTNFVGFLVCDSHGNKEFQCTLEPTLPSIQTP